MLQIFSLLFWRNQLFWVICTVQVITLGDIDGSVAEKFRRWTVPLHAHWVCVMYAGSIPGCDTFFLFFILFYHLYKFLKCFLF